MVLRDKEEVSIHDGSPKKDFLRKKELLFHEKDKKYLPEV